MSHISWQSINPLEKQWFGRILDPMGMQGDVMDELGLPAPKGWPNMSEDPVIPRGPDAPCSKVNNLKEERVLETPLGCQNTFFGDSPAYQVICR